MWKVVVAEPAGAENNAVKQGSGNANRARWEGYGKIVVSLRFIELRVFRETAKIYYLEERL